MRDVSVAAVVVTYNRRTLLERCLESLLAQTRPLEAVYVIDNASTDGTAGYLAGVASPAVRRRRLPANAGGAGGFHAGIQWAYQEGHDWIWIMDDDCAVDPDALAKLLAAAEATPGIAALAPRTTTPERRPFSTELIWDGTRRALRGPTEDELSRAVYDCDYVGFVAVLLKRDAVGRVGFPLAELFLWSDDTEYSARLRTAGRIVIVPSAFVVHEQPRLAAELAHTSYWKHYYGQRNRIVLRHRVHPYPGALELLYSAARQAAAIVVKRDHKFYRLRVLGTAVFHGFCGRLGPGPEWLRA